MRQDSHQPEGRDPGSLEAACWVWVVLASTLWSPLTLASSELITSPKPVPRPPQASLSLGFPTLVTTWGQDTLMDRHHLSLILCWTLPRACVSTGHPFSSKPHPDIHERALAMQCFPIPECSSKPKMSLLPRRAAEAKDLKSDQHCLGPLCKPGWLPLP